MICGFIILSFQIHGDICCRWLLSSRGLWEPGGPVCMSDIWNTCSACGPGSYMNGTGPAHMMCTRHFRPAAWQYSWKKPWNMNIPKQWDPTGEVRCPAQKYQLWWGSWRGTANRGKNYQIHFCPSKTVPFCTWNCPLKRLLKNFHIFNCNLIRSVVNGGRE